MSGGEPVGVCAYCGREGPLTCEHRWPDCLLRRVGGRPTYLRKADKVIESDVKTRDVCESCNHGALSELDDYICELFDRYFANPVDDGQSVDFSYDYDRLARWLLKTAYNGARADGDDTSALRECAPYILRGYPRPTQVRILIGVTRPLKTQGGPRYRTAFTDGKSDHPVALTAFRVWRYIGIFAYNFGILIPKPGAMPEEKYPRTVDGLRGRTHGYTLLEQDRAMIRLTACDLGLDRIDERFNSETRKAYAAYRPRRRGYS